MDPETRESLIARLPNHADSAAWNEFVELYEPLIYGIGRRHGLQPADAGDLVQEVLASVADSIERFEPDQNRGRFRAWLFRVARNHALTQLRKLKRVGTATGDSGERNVLATYPADDQSDTEFDAAFRRRAFRWAARRVRETVKPQTWDVFARTAINGESPQSVAQDLGIDIGAVYLSRSRVMSRLRRMVENVSIETLANFDSSEVTS
jgi:RNA polymerase sigma-70 factor (ECF subfamily)